MTEPTATPLPPVLDKPNSPTGDPLMDIAWRKQNGNGKQYLSQRKNAIDGLQSKLKRFGISAEVFTELVDAHLTEKGTKLLADGDGELADRELTTAQSFVVELCSVGRRFHVASGITALWQSWRDNDKRTNPSEYQLIQHATQLVAGKFEKQGGKPSGPPKFKQWCLDKFGTDIISTLNIPESVLRQQYEQATRIH